MDPEPAPVSRVPGAALVNLDAGHKERGVRLVHSQTEAFIRHLLKILVLKSALARCRIVLGSGRGVALAAFWPRR